jgi:hypothetical protein
MRKDNTAQGSPYVRIVVASNYRLEVVENESNIYTSLAINRHHHIKTLAL